ncbi:MAG TPA: DUF423 domain-containing protein [Oceanospirillaceae bacterium]|nr:DUF423 domain-containing protein [Oceanospirillaceae bacterium]
MQPSYRRYLISAAILAGLAVALGAFATHGLKPILSARMLAAFNTAADYQMTHALGLLITAWIASQHPNNPWFLAAMRLFVMGILLFSGSLYIMSLSGISQLGMITPLGGLSLLGAWTCLAFAFYKISKN